MEQIIAFFSMSMIAIFIENSVFVRGIGAGRILTNSRKKMHTLYFGLLVVGMTLISSVSCYFVNMLLKNFAFRSYIMPFAFLLTISIIYTILNIGLYSFRREFYRKISDLLPYATFNCVILGTILISSYQNYTFEQSVAYGVGSGVGYLLASIMITAGQKRLEQINIPKSFRGLPIIILYVGIISLALYGLIGHKISY